jgi:UDP-2-acetamido-3-amino-2,3-dideoxy-glucuronate N-acetyltransferase
MPTSDYFVHDSAIVDDGATIGAGTKIWHFVHVMPGAVIGGDCVIGQGCYIGNVTIGGNVKIQNNVSVYDGVTIEDDVFCGPSCVFTNVINPRSGVNRKAEFLPTLVKRGATIGANATIVCGATVGEYAFIAAGAVVRGDVPAHALMVGVPARRVGWMDENGNREGSVRSASAPGRGIRLGLVLTTLRVAQSNYTSPQTHALPPALSRREPWRPWLLAFGVGVAWLGWAGQAARERGQSGCSGPFERLRAEG